jgi:hypothetical protein
MKHNIDMATQALLTSQAMELQTLRARVKELEKKSALPMKYKRMEHNAELQRQLAACEKERDRLLKNAYQVETLKFGLAASQHYAQQLREALIEARAAIYGAREVIGNIGNIQHAIELSDRTLSLPHDTSALDEFEKEK